MKADRSALAGEQILTSSLVYSRVYPIISRHWHDWLTQNGDSHALFIHSITCDIQILYVFL